MDMLRTIREIGLFETAINLEKVSESADVILKVGASMPLPDVGVGERLESIAEWLYNFGKNKYMFLTPEIALIEKVAEHAGADMESIIAIPCDIEEEAKERLKNNLPHGIKITVLEEPYFPGDFLPEKSMLVVCGYSGGGRVMVLPDTYRMAEHYNSFLGKKVFVPYVELDTSARYNGWIEIDKRRFRAEWRSNYE